MEKRRLSDEPRCESRQETSYKITKGNSALSIETMPPDNDTLDTVTMPPGNDTLDTVTMARKERENNGPWEIELSYEGEAGLHKSLTGCKKNPDHVDFIPVDQFKVEHLRHLPPCYQDNDLVEVVKAMSDLTVRVSVDYVSNKRPETVSGKPYPCYKNRESNLVRVGSGWVYSVITYRNEICRCKECLNSEKPRTNFSSINIRTAAHVVYDKDEGAHTTCHLFFDRGITPDACSGVVKLSETTRIPAELYPVELYPEQDLCEMTYVTHDRDLIDKLYDMVVRFYILLDKIKIKYKKQDLSKDYVPVIIVSHPHGCSKQVSVGSSEIVPLNCPYGLLYTTSTCPGTSGALVWPLYDQEPFTGSWSCHSGHADAELTGLKSGKGLNYSLY